MKLHMIKTRSRSTTLALLSGLLITFSQSPLLGAEMPRKGVTPHARGQHRVTDRMDT
jgi:hypothetical protein